MAGGVAHMPGYQTSSIIDLAQTLSIFIVRGTPLQMSAMITNMRRTSSDGKWDSRRMTIDNNIDINYDNIDDNNDINNDLH